MVKIDEAELNFPAFPYQPYSIQLDFMRSLYRYLDQGGVSMLESPTGTGKTLSIICSAVQWVLDRRQKEKLKTEVEVLDKKDVSQMGSDDEPDWMRSFVPNKDNDTPGKEVAKKKSGLVKYNKRRTDESSKDVRKVESDSLLDISDDGFDSNDGEFLLEEYESEDEGSLGGWKSKRKAGGDIALSSDDDEENDSDEEEEKDFKIFFCSRTHSQLSQFVKELRKTVFPAEINVVCLASRKNFCINQEVLKLGNSGCINERCLDLQKKRKDQVSKVKNLGEKGRIRQTKSSAGCPMLRKQNLQKQFREEISQQGALDIEDLVQLGRSLGTCPYYGSRNMVPAADLVVLPYQSLLSKSSRESLGLNLKKSIVIIDEAHNLADSLINMYDAKVTSSQVHNYLKFARIHIQSNQLELVYSHVEKYFTRFRNVLGPGNRRYIQTLIVLTRAFLRSLCGEQGSAGVHANQVEDAVNSKDIFHTSVAINEFLFSLNIDNINLVKLLQYVKESNLVYKVSGYGEKVIALQKVSPLSDNKDLLEEGSILSSFRALVDMLVSLTNNNGDGRIIISKGRSTCDKPQGGTLKYVMLTGEKIFSEIVDQAHAVILAGGTLQPIEETRERLFPRLPLDQLHFFSCGHIVPPQSILPIAVSLGPSGQALDFSYSSRSSLTTINELGLLLCNLVTVVPEGIVVFFSSFEYEEQVHGAWKASGILGRIMKKKRIFREPRKSCDVELVLNEYKETILKLSSGSKDVVPCNGAILLAVVGGKVSEGINFSDGMGRCVVMVGLPYASPSDVELMERVKYIESLGDKNSTKIFNWEDEHYAGNLQASFSILRSCKHRGKEYYENLCMKAVNQSIGRAIRHVNDYAAVLLVDRRYASSDSLKRSASHPTNKLPNWIKDRLVSATSNYGEVHRLLNQFFKLNKSRRPQ
ncbi:ATP-dependent DNA helicase DDX11 [Linum perenne]